MLATVLAAVTSCAYFNTLYNAKQTFKEAQKADARAATTQTRSQPQQTTPVASPSARQYEDVIEKCKKMIANYPDSRHVDDAMLLSARALYALGRYDEAVAALDTLEHKRPNSNLLKDAAFLKAKSLYSAKKFDLAAPALRDFVRDNRKNSNRPEALYLLCASLMELGLHDEAVAALETLEKDHGRSQYRFRAQVEMADILARKEFYKESLAVYERLSSSRIPESYRYDVWLGMASVQYQVGDPSGAIRTLENARALTQLPDKEPIAILLLARSHAALDSTALALTELTDVTQRFARGVYAAEAYYRLGILYEGMDSLETAQHNYEEVPRAYSGSEFAEDAIKRAGNISRVLRLQETAGDDSPEAIAMRTFSMAEIQFFQFENMEKAITNYQKIVSDFPDSEYAPRAVYALGYINGVVLGDSVKAREWYDVLVSRYPDSAQARLAYGFYKGAPEPPSLAEWTRMESSAPKKGAAAPPDTTATRTPAPAETKPVSAPPDTSAAAVPVPVPADTSSAPADSTGGG